MVDRQEVDLDTWECEGGSILPSEALVDHPGERTYTALRDELQEALVSTARNHLRTLSRNDQLRVTSTGYITVPLGQLRLQS